MKRRAFIKKSSVIGIPFMLDGVKVSALDNLMFNFLNMNDDRVLVLIQMDGGNDGLNMVIPKDQYSNLMEVRGNILIPESRILDITDTVGFHPKMEDLKNVYDDNKLSVIQNVGYPNQNRSHFRSTDIWTTGSPANEVWDTGWLGRYFDLLAPSFPTGFPNNDFPDPLAVTFGNSSSETCEGAGGSFSLAVVNAEDPSPLTTPINATSPDTCFGNKMDYLVNAIVQTNAYNVGLQNAYANGSNLSGKYEESSTLAQKLKGVARLISGGLRTKVYVVNIGGFDTHNFQVLEGDKTSGVHAALLEELSSAICAFQDDLQLLGLDERVVGMTYSEFGRRIRSNFGLGTDHGTAGPMMLFGSCVNAGVIGDNPVISPNASAGEGVAMQFDFRSIYGSVLMDWFGVEENIVKNLLYEDFQYIPVINSCNSVYTHDFLDASLIEIQVFPNPFNDSITIQFSVPSGFIKISLFDVIGNELKVISSGHFASGTHTIQMNGNQIPAGTYFYRIQTAHGSKVSRVVKVR